MIRTEYCETRSDGVRLLKTYSDAGMMIEQNQTGRIYEEAVDVENSEYTYTETETLIEIDDAEALRILLGGEPE